jgi:uncharacterized damage-inducible protein DinB
MTVDPTPLWKTPTRSQAKEILVVSRSRIEALVGELTDGELRRTTEVGGGVWSVKDLLGHLACCEEQAVAWITGKKPRFDYGRFSDGDERNAADVERKRSWSLKRVRQDLDQTRSALLKAIDDMDDQEWMRKVETSAGRSALGLALGRLLVGGKHGLYAHDLAHARDLERSVDKLRAARG